MSDEYYTITYHNGNIAILRVEYGKIKAKRYMHIEDESAVSMVSYKNPFAWSNWSKGPSIDIYYINNSMGECHKLTDQDVFLLLL
jgi:hypothetical protein